MRSVLLVIVLLGIIGTGAANAEERQGRWKIVTVSTYGKEKVTARGTAKIWQLKNGTVRATSRIRVRGQSVRSEAYSYKNGTTQSYSYVDGELAEISEGTWTMRGNRTSSTSFFEGLNGSGRVDAYTRRVNRNKFIQYAEVRIDGLRGKIRQTSTFTRIRK